MSNETKQDHGRFTLVRLADLSESDLNPRKHFDEAGLADLTESIKSKGLIEPIVVRPLNGSGKFEIVVGARRFRAATLAQLEKIPAIVREYDDVQTLEVQVIENLQRMDVNPMEEADGYQKLVEIAGYTTTGRKGQTLPDVARIASKIGKSTRYVYDRLTMAGKLIPEAREAGAAGWIAASHLVELARLAPEQQRLGLAAVLSDSVYGDESLEQAMESWRTPPDQLDAWIELRALSVRELQDWIQENIHRTLSNAFWDMKDECLYAKAGACSYCMKRSDAELGEAPEVTAKSHCLDPECFKQKHDAFLAKMEAQIEAKTGQKPVKWSSGYTREKGVKSSWEVKASEEGAKDAVVGLDVNTGQMCWITVAKPVSHKTTSYDSKAEEQKRETTEKEARKRADVENAARRVALKEVLAKMKGLPTREDLMDVLKYTIRDEEEKKDVQEWTGVKLSTSMNDGDLRKVLMVSIMSDLKMDWWRFSHSQKIEPCEALENCGKRLGVNVKEIIKSETRKASGESISGVDVKKAIKAGAKKMKVKVKSKKK